MKDPFWYEDMNILFQKDRLTEFYLKKDLSTSENFNAATRFLIYAGVVTTFLKQDVDYLIITIILLVIVAYIEKSNVVESYKGTLAAAIQPDISQKVDQDCQESTPNNPFGNVLINQYDTDPKRDPACFYDNMKEDIHTNFFDNFEQDKYDVFDKNHSQRQFYTTANTQIPNDQDAFAKFLYEQPLRCKQDPDVCTGWDT